MSSSSAPRPATSFVARAKQLKTPFLIGDSARTVLVDAMVLDAAKLLLSKCVEPAAALAWARANIDAAPEWLDLPAPMLKRVRDLYDAPFKAAWSVEQQIHAIRCSVRAAMPAAVLILPPQVPGAVGGQRRNLLLEISMQEGLRAWVWQRSLRLPSFPCLKERLTLRLARAVAALEDFPPPAWESTPARAPSLRTPSAFQARR